MEQARTAVVTGANRGIGYEIARQLAQTGMQVIGTCRRAADGERATAQLADEGLSVRFDRVDVTVEAAVREWANGTAADVLVNNAGIALDAWKSGLEVDLDTVRTTLEVNLIGALACCQAFLPGMVERGYGRVVNVSSQLGSLERMTGLTLAYRVSKTALNAVTRCLADEVKETDVLINSVCPGWVRTELGGADAPRDPEEAADTAIWLATLPSGGPNGGFFQDRERLPL